MTNRLCIAIVIWLAAASPAAAVDWIFAPSTYTHDPQTAKRVNQFAEPPPQYVHIAPDYRRSGFRYNTSVNRVGGNADRIHIVEEWGRTVRPYGEWQYPYRPYSVPYDAWGPPFGGLGGRGFGGGPIWPRPWLGPYGHPPPHGPGPGAHGGGKHGMAPAQQPFAPALQNEGEAHGGSERSHRFPGGSIRSRSTEDFFAPYEQGAT